MDYWFLAQSFFNLMVCFTLGYVLATRTASRDLEDTNAIEEALSESSERIPYDKVRSELGLAKGV